MSAERGVSGYRFDEKLRKLVFLIHPSWPCWGGFSSNLSSIGNRYARDTLASRIIANYMAGMVDELELISLSKQPLAVSVP